MNSEAQTCFWSRTYSVRNRAIILNLYFGETKLSELNGVIDDAKTELSALGVTFAPETTVLTAKRAGMCISCRLSYRENPAGLERLRTALEGQKKWKMAAD